LSAISEGFRAEGFRNEAGDVVDVVVYAGSARLVKLTADQAQDLRAVLDGALGE
jgi:hypothetical protein